MDSLKTMLLTNWNFMRWLRLAIGVYAAVQAVMLHDTLLGFLASFFLFQAVTNTGCMAGGSCVSISKASSKNAEKSRIEYEEIK